MGSYRGGSIFGDPLGVSEAAPLWICSVLRDLGAADSILPWGISKLDPILGDYHIRANVSITLAGLDLPISWFPLPSPPSIPSKLPHSLLF